MRQELGTDLKPAWGDLGRWHPGIGVRPTRAVLGVSEAELVASLCGEASSRLDADWAALVSELPALGPVVAVTRNRRAVHEKNGCYGNIRILGAAGVVLNGAVDLRLHLDHWHFGFAVSEGRRRSLQFFGRDGSAVHKVYLTPASDGPAYDDLVRRYASPDQSTEQAIASRAGRAAERPDRQVSVNALRGAWSAPEESHDLQTLLRSFGISRPQALRLAGHEFAHRVARAAVAHVLGRVAATGTPLMVMVANPGTVQIHTGRIHRVVVDAQWISVRDPGFNLKLRADRIHSAWVVKKPTRDGVINSLELFDAAGDTIALVFAERTPGQPDMPAWRSMLAKLPTVQTAD